MRREQSMRPNEREVLLGLQSALATYVLPEVQTEHARLEVMLIVAVLGGIATELDGVAQRLVDDNDALRVLARRGAESLVSAGGDAGPESASLAADLRSLASESDASVRLSDLSAANDRLHAAVARLGALAEAGAVPALRELRPAVIERLREEAESRALSLLGPRAEG